MRVLYYSRSGKAATRYVSKVAARTIRRSTIVGSRTTNEWFASGSFRRFINSWGCIVQIGEECWTCPISVILEWTYRVKSRRGARIMKFREALCNTTWSARVFRTVFRLQRRVLFLRTCRRDVRNAAFLSNLPRQIDARRSVESLAVSSFAVSRIPDSIADRSIAECG